MIWAIYSLANSFGTGWLLCPGDYNSALHSSNVTLATHLVLYYLAAHSFIARQSLANRPVDCLIDSHASPTGVTLIAERPLARTHAEALAWASLELFNCSLAQLSESGP